MNEELTLEYFDSLLENMVKGTKERCYRRMRLKPGNPLKPVDHSPEKSMNHGLQHEGDNDPMKTGRGKASVKRQARENQAHPERFAEAIEFIRENAGDDTAISKLASIKDKQRLKLLVWQLLTKPNPPFADWLKSISHAT